MKSRVLLYTALFFAALSVSCSKEDYTPEQEPEPVINKENTVAYTVTVREGTSTRASLNGNSYIFQEEDKLYVIGDNGNVHGVLDLTAGAGTGSATFFGDLSYPSGYEPDPKLKLNATLVSANDKIHDITTNPGYVSATVYPTSVNALASSLEEAVEWYSDFTGEGEYEKKIFTLHQNSAFLKFTVKYVDLPESILTGPDESKTVAISFTNEDESGNPDPVSARAGSKMLEQKEGYIVTEFAAAFPGGTTKLNSCLISVKVGDDGEIRTFALADATLAANKKYNVSRISSCEFSVLTRENNTTIQFNYVDNSDGAQYKVGSGEWTAYPSNTDNPNFKITVETAGTVVMFRSKRSGSYKNQKDPANPSDPESFPTKGNKTIFKFSKSVYVYGDIMSLKSTGSGDNYIIGNTLTNECEFAGAFWGVDNIDIPADRFLVLSAQNLTSNCYQNMFRENTITAGNHIIISAYKMAPYCCNGMFKKCTSFASAPVIKAEELAPFCCRSMFESCNLTVLPELPATKLALSCYRQMFQGCKGLTDIQGFVLPATTLEPQCYFSMFYQCSNLTNSPVLPAPTLVESCYETMFSQTKVASVKCLATDISANRCTFNWLSSAASQGTFTKKSGVTWNRGASGIPNNWDIIDIVD